MRCVDDYFENHELCIRSTIIVDCTKPVLYLYLREFVILLEIFLKLFILVTRCTNNIILI